MGSLRKTEQFFFAFLNASHILVVVCLAVAVKDGAGGGAHDLICLWLERLDRESNRDKILNHGKLIANLLHCNDRVHEALEDERYLSLLLRKVKMLVQRMEEQRVIVGRDSPGFHQEEVCTGLERGSQVNHRTIPAISDRDGHTTSWCLKQI